MTHVRPVILTVVLLFSLGAVAQQSAAHPGAQSNQPQTAQPNQEPQPAPPSQQSPATVSSDNSLPREDKVQKIRALREATIAKVRGLLNDDQKKKLDQILEGPSERPEPKEPPK